MFTGYKHPHYAHNQIWRLSRQAETGCPHSWTTKLNLEGNFLVSVQLVVLSSDWINENVPAAQVTLENAITLPSTVGEVPDTQLHLLCTAKYTDSEFAYANAALEGTSLHRAQGVVCLTHWLSVV